MTQSQPCPRVLPRRGQIAIFPLTSRLMPPSQERLLGPGKRCPLHVQSSSEDGEPRTCGPSPQPPPPAWDFPSLVG